MGSLAKILGQFSRKSFESESKNIIKTTAANKKGLSKLLDSTLKTSHDMKVFGLGTAASMASRDRYARFTRSMHAVYSAMETGLDSRPSPAIATVWDKFGDDLRRSEALRLDLIEVIGEENSWPECSPATLQYISAIESAMKADSETQGGRLLGHLYCRYFADLFGGQALGGPYRYALGLERSPRHYDFAEFGVNRRESIERIYESLNEAGEILQDEMAREAVLSEARVAFKHNIAVYREDGKLFSDGICGGANMVIGYSKSYFV